MKKLSLLFLITLAIACSKKEIVVPQQDAASTAVNYKDDYISVREFKAAADSSDQSRIVVSFTAALDKNVQKIEIMKGNTENNLCAAYVIKLNAPSVQSKYYSYVDNAGSNKNTYYMLKYTLNNNNWGYTPVYKFKNQ